MTNKVINPSCCCYLIRSWGARSLTHTFIEVIILIACNLHSRNSKLIRRFSFYVAEHCIKCTYFVIKSKLIYTCKLILYIKIIYWITNFFFYFYWACVILFWEITFMLVSIPVKRLVLNKIVLSFGRLALISLFKERKSISIQRHVTTTYNVYSSKKWRQNKKKNNYYFIITVTTFSFQFFVTWRYSGLHSVSSVISWRYY